MRAVLVLLTVAACSAKKYVLPATPPPEDVANRTTRDTAPLWLFEGDVPRTPPTGEHPTLPQFIDDVKIDPNRRTARSLSTPNAVGSHNPGDSKSGSGEQHKDNAGSQLGPNVSILSVVSGLHPKDSKIDSDGREDGTGSSSPHHRQSRQITSCI